MRLASASAIAEARVVGKRVHPCWQRGANLRALDHEKVDSEMNAPSFRLAVKERGVAVQHSIFVVATDSYRDAGLDGGHDRRTARPRLPLPLILSHTSTASQRLVVGQ